MVNKVLLLFLMLHFSLYSQDENAFVNKGTIKAMATLSPSKIFSKNISPFYLHGNLEFYLDKKISVSGDGYYFLGDLSNEKSTFNFHHSLFFGTNFHFIKNNNDFYIGFQPGIDISEINSFSSKTLVNPLISVNVGYKLFVSRYFNFFILMKNTYGENILIIPFNISDIRFSAGLGFHI